MQANVQDYVDQAISNTVNLPKFGTEGNNNTEKLAHTIARYLPRLKGLTVYPNESRSGQPLSPVDFYEAMEHDGVVFEEESERCLNGVCQI